MTNSTKIKAVIDCVYIFQKLQYTCHDVTSLEILCRMLDSEEMVSSYTVTCDGECREPNYFGIEIYYKKWRI